MDLRLSQHPESYEVYSLNTQISSAALLQSMSHEKLVAKSFVRKNPASTLPWKHFEPRADTGTNLKNKMDTSDTDVCVLLDDLKEKIGY
jgi:hypothetical protein